MGRRPSDAPERLTLAAAASLREQGFHATAIKDVAVAARVPMGSLYFHFPGGKQELVRRALDVAGSAADGAIADRFALADDARTAVAAYIAQLADQLERSGFRDGCPLATTALEIGADDDVLAATIARWYDSWRDRIAERLRADAYEEPEQLATLVISAVEGALLLARVQRSTAPVTTVAGVLDAVLAGAQRRGVDAPTPAPSRPTAARRRRPPA